MSGKSVSLVIPVFNEQSNLPTLIERCVSVGRTLDRDFEIVMVDDGSSDDSAQLIARAVDSHPDHCVGVLLNRNYGQHAAVLAGFATARGDTVVTLDADLQNPPEEIPKLLALVDQGHDVVGGVRQLRQDTLFRVMASRWMNRIIRRVTGIDITDYGCMLRAYRRDVVDAMLRCEERSAYVPALANAFAGHPAEVPVAHAERGAGRSSYNLWSLVNLYFDLLVSTSTVPLRLLSLVGIVMAVGGAAFGVLLLILRFAYGAEWAAQGVFTIFSPLFIFLGMQFVAMGLLGEYIGRISRDVQRRPRYLIEKTLNRDSLRSVAVQEGKKAGAA
jgi:undecaprenyl-phosphate 4-deoxy-4-formamido-L-arabinose transferase